MKVTSIHRSILVVAAVLTLDGRSFAQYEPDKAFAFIQAVHNRQDRSLNNYLVAELQSFVDQFPEDRNAAEAAFLLASIFEAKGDEHQALATYFKVLYLHPASSRQAASTDAARKIVTAEKAYGAKRERVLALLEGQTGGTDAGDRAFTYLAFLKYVDQPSLHELTLRECRDFLRRFAADERVDKVLQWIADVQIGMGDHREAEASYLKLDYAAPQSPLLVQTRYRRGEILYKELGEHEKAAEVFSGVVAAFPDSGHYAGNALFMLGEIKQKKLKDYRGALADYRTLVDTYPDNDLASDAYFAMAELQAGRLEAPAEAVAVYDEFVSKGSGDEKRIQALEKAADLLRGSKLLDYGRAAQYYARVAELFPTYEKAPDMLLRAGDLCESKLKDNEKAIAYYQAVVDKYPEHRLAAEAKRRIAKAQPKQEQ